MNFFARCCHITVRAGRVRCEPQHSSYSGDGYLGSVANRKGADRETTGNHLPPLFTQEVGMDELLRKTEERPNAC